MFKTIWVYRGMQLILVGLMIQLLALLYRRYLEVDNCPFCKAEVPEGADLCPSCFRSLVGYQGIDMMTILQGAVLLFLCFVVVVFSLIPHRWVG